jgi:hypothetical protein
MSEAVSDKVAIHRALQMVAGACDGASTLDGHGFSKFDVHRGKAWAYSPEIPDAELFAAAQMANKYRGQLPDYMAEQVHEIAQRLSEAPARVFDIEAVPWSEPKIIPTRAGPKQIREWFIEGEEFWVEWRKGKLKADGYSVSKFKGQWKLTEWRQPDGEQTPTNKRNAEKLERIEKQETHAAGFEPELTGAVRARFEQIAAKLLPYQIAHVKRLIIALLNFLGAVDASDTGTGKTYSALAAVAALGMKAFVICPKSVIPSWGKAARHFGMKIAAINYEKLRTGKTEFGRYVGDEKKRSFRFETLVLDPDEWVLIFDECHRMKDYKTLNCGLGIAAIEQKFQVLALSATAADNPMQMKFIALLTKLIWNARQFFGWMTQNGCQKGRFGMEFVGGREHLSRIHAQVFPSHGSRIRISELGDQFPETKIIAEAYDMNGAREEIQAIYDTMHRELAQLDERQKDDGESHLTVMLRARQKVELLKVPTICQMAEDGMAEGMAVIVIVNFEDSLTAIASRLRTTNVIHGGQDPENREMIRERFDSDKENIIVMNIRAGGVGISLHGTRDSRTRLSLISPTFSGQDLKQAFGRPWRAGGAFSIQKVLFAAGTIEEEACEKVRDKITRIDALNGDELETALRF